MSGWDRAYVSAVASESAGSGVDMLKNKQGGGGETKQGPTNLLGAPNKIKCLSGI